RGRRACADPAGRTGRPALAATERDRPRLASHRGPGSRDSSRGLAADLRPLLHHPADRHRSRLADCKEHHRGARRDAGSSEQRRGHHHRPRPAQPAAERDDRFMSATGSILLVDDEEKILKTLGRALRTEGHRVVESGSAREAKRVFSASFDVLILENLMPGPPGLELIRELVASSPEHERPQIIMMTAHATVADAIEAMKLGALDFLQKPFEVEHLLVTVSRAVEDQPLRTQHPYLLSERNEDFSHYGIVGRSRSMQEIIHRAERVAETKSRSEERRVGKECRS